MDDEAQGFIFDFTRTCDNVYETYGLIEDIKNSCVDSFKYSGSGKELRSNTIVVFSNFLPNMCALSHDRWSFFHTRLGSVFFHCQPVKGDKEYACLLSEKNSCSVKNPKLKFLAEKSDDDLIREYVDHHLNVKKREPLSFLYENVVSFPCITPEHRAHIKNFINEKNIAGLKNYVRKFDCFKGSILTNEMIKNFPLFGKTPNSNESSTESEEEED